MQFTHEAVNKILKSPRRICKSKRHWVAFKEMVQRAYKARSCLTSMQCNKKFQINFGMPARRNQQHPITISISRSRSNITDRHDSLKTVPQQLNRFQAKRACSSVHNTTLHDNFIVNLAIRPMFDTAKKKTLNIMKTCPCKVYPLKPTFI